MSGGSELSILPCLKLLWTMKSLVVLLLAGVILNFVVLGVLVSHWERQSEVEQKAVLERGGGDVAGLSDVEERLAELQRQIELMPTWPVAVDGEKQTDPGMGELKERLGELERSMASLQETMSGISLEDASAERDELFRGENGDVKAAEYFETGKYSIAGEGYLTFLAAHPDHPEHRSIVERARQAFVRAGNLDKALAVQNELMEMYPENRAKDLMTLANLQREKGDFSSAAASARESAGLVNDSGKYWNLLYSAWYTQLGDGLDAGLEAHLALQKQITAAGYTEGKLSDRVQEKISELERQIAAGGN